MYASVSAVACEAAHGAFGPYSPVCLLLEVGLPEDLGLQRVVHGRKIAFRWVAAGLADAAAGTEDLAAVNGDEEGTEQNTSFRPHRRGATHQVGWQLGSPSQDWRQQASALALPACKRLPIARRMAKVVILVLKVFMLLGLSWGLNGWLCW